MVEDNKIIIVCANYNLETGKFEIIDE